MTTLQIECIKASYIMITIKLYDIKGVLNTGKNTTFDYKNHQHYSDGDGAKLYLKDKSFRKHNTISTTMPSKHHFQ